MNGHPAPLAGSAASTHATIYALEIKAVMMTAAKPG